MNACRRSSSAIAWVSCADTLGGSFATRLGFRLALGFTTVCLLGATVKVSPLGLVMVIGNATLAVCRFHAFRTLTVLTMSLSSLVMVRAEALADRCGIEPHLPSPSVQRILIRPYMKRTRAPPSCLVEMMTSEPLLPPYRLDEISR